MGPPPIGVTADFTGTPLTGAAPLAVTFTDLSTGAILTWSWTFGDGGTSTLQNPIHTYNSAGTWTVALTVTDGGPSSDTKTRVGYVVTSAPWTPASGSAPLFISGLAPASGTAPLFATGYLASSGDAPLFVGGVGASSGSLDLYVSGSGDGTPASGAVPLFVAGNAQFGTGADLYAVSSAAGSGALPLVLVTDDRPVASGFLTLTIAGTSQSGAFAGADLYVWSDPSGNVATGPFPLYLAGATTGGAGAEFNLWTEGRAHDAAAGLELFLNNSSSGTFAGLGLFVSGDGVAAGMLPGTGQMNLYLARNPSEAVPLFILAPGQESSGAAPLFARGAGAASGAADLAIPNVVGHRSGSARLFTSGW